MKKADCSTWVDSVNFAEEIMTNVHGVVPKRSKGAVCKTVIRRFESGRRLFLALNLLLSFQSCLGGGIGRHYGLKIRWLYKPCRFESGPGYSTRNPTHHGAFCLEDDG